MIAAAAKSGGDLNAAQMKKLQVGARLSRLYTACTLAGGCEVQQHADGLALATMQDAVCDCYLTACMHAPRSVAPCICACGMPRSTALAWGRSCGFGNEVS